MTIITNTLEAVKNISYLTAYYALPAYTLYALIQGANA